MECPHIWQSLLLSSCWNFFLVCVKELSSLYLLIGMGFDFTASIIIILFWEVTSMDWATWLNCFIFSSFPLRSCGVVAHSIFMSPGDWDFDMRAEHILCICWSVSWSKKSVRLVIIFFIYLNDFSLKNIDQLKSKLLISVPLSSGKLFYIQAGYFYHQNKKDTFLQSYRTANNPVSEF